MNVEGMGLIPHPLSILYFVILCFQFTEYSWACVFLFMYFRIESTYRTWVHATKDASSIWNCDELDRDLRTALGTTKWQVISPLISFPTPHKIPSAFHTFG